MGRFTRRQRTSGGFTTMELLMVMTIIAIITAIAYPSLQTFSARQADTDVATKVVHTFNRVKAQARRRNRAYLVTFKEMDNARPDGEMIIREGMTSSCRYLLEDLNDNSRLIDRVPFGTAPMEAYVGNVREDVGFIGWVAQGGEADDLEGSDLVLCVGADGAVAQVVGAQNTLVPLAGRIALKVRRFQPNGGGWSHTAPARSVSFTFAGGARLELN